MVQQFRNGNLRTLPKAILEKTDIAPGLELYWNAYCELTTCRPASFGGLLPIPWTAMDSYAERYQFSEDQFETLVYICRDMDKTMAEYIRKKE